MATSMSSISRRICRSLLSKPTSQLSTPFCRSFSTHELHSDLDDSAPKLDDFAPNLDSDSTPIPPFKPEAEQNSNQQRTANSALENGLDNGIYKAILVGQVGQLPLQKTLRNGSKIVLFSLGTGGIRNNRRPLMNEDPKEYANRCTVQWHRVCVYQQKMGDMAMKHVVPGSIMYLEGNLETRVYTDHITGLARRVREIAIRRDGRLVFLGKGTGDQQLEPVQIKGVGYY